ncbi:MAG: Dabb family protein [Paracoccaceae bacterium]
MILHCVYCAIREDVPREDVAAAMADLASLRGTIAGMTGFAWGPNRDFDQRTGAYTHGIVASFADRAAFSAWRDHPDRKAATARLSGLCRGGYGGVISFDIDTRGR